MILPVLSLACFLFVAYGVMTGDFPGYQLLIALVAAPVLLFLYFVHLANEFHKNW